MKKLKPILTYFISSQGTKHIVIILLLIFIGTGIYRMFFNSSCIIDNWLGTPDKQETITFIGLGIAGLIGLIALVINNRRAQAQEKTADAHYENNKQKTFNDAVINLGNDSSSVRLGGIYSLYEMAKEFKEKK